MIASHLRARMEGLASTRSAGSNVNVPLAGEETLARLIPTMDVLPIPVKTVANVLIRHSVSGFLVLAREAGVGTNARWIQMTGVQMIPATMVPAKIRQRALVHTTVFVRLDGEETIVTSTSTTGAKNQIRVATGGRAGI